MAKNKTAQILAAVVCASTVLTLSPVHNAFAADDNTGVGLNVSKGTNGITISVAGNNNSSVLLGNDGDVGVNSINGVEVKTDANGNIILNTTAKPDTVFNLNSMQSNLNNLANAGIAPGWIKTDEQIKQSGFMEQLKDSLAGGKNGVAIGADSYAGRSGIAIGTGANKSAGIGARRGAISIGSDSNSKGLYSTVIGTKAELNDDPKQSIKISGQTQTVQGAAATVIGSYNKVETKSQDRAFASVGNNIIGAANTVTDSNGVAIQGSGNKVTNAYKNMDVSKANISEILKGDFSSVLEQESGEVAVIGGNNTIENTTATTQIGSGTNITDSEGVFTIGKKNTLNKVQNSVVIGNNITVTDVKNAIAIGNVNKIASNAVVVGMRAAADYDSIALGRDATALHQGVAIGSNTNVTDNSVAIGQNSEATAANSVSLGVNSTATGAYSVAIGDKSKATGEYEVSVGSKADNITRKITNVTAGEISATSTDAVNGSQLNEVKNSKLTINLAQPNGTVQTVKKGLGDSLLVTGKNANILASYDEANSAVSVDLNKNLVDMQSINNNQVKFNQDKSTTFADKVTVKADGKISGLTAGTADNEAVNVGQLNEVKAQAGKHTTLTTNDGNVGLTKTETDGQLNYDVALNKNLKDIESVNGLKIGDFDGAFTTLSTNEKNATGNVKIYSDGGILADGRITSNADVVSHDGNKNKDYSLNTVGNDLDKFKEAGIIAGTTKNDKNPGSYQIAIGNGSVVNAEKGTAIGSGAKVNQGASESVALGTGSVANWNDVVVDGKNDPRGVVSVGKSGDDGFTRRIINVKAGINDTDAVNVSQLNKVSAEASKHTTLSNGDSNLNITDTNQDPTKGANYQINLSDTVNIKNSLSVGNALVANQHGVVINGVTWAQGQFTATDGNATVQVNNGTIGINADTLKINGLSIGAKDVNNLSKISGVAAGEISATSTDAVNGSQLNDIKTLAGKHTTLTTTDEDSNIIITETNKDGQLNYDVKLNDKLTLGTGDNQVVINGNDGSISTTAKGQDILSGSTKFNVNSDGISLDVDNGSGHNSSMKLTQDNTTFSYSEGGATQATTTVIQGQKITAGSVKINAEAGKSTITGLNNTTWNGTTDDSSRVATEGQLQNIYDTASKQHSIVEAGDNIVVDSTKNTDGANVYTVSVAKDLKVNSIKATDDVATENYSINANGEEIDKLHSAGIVAGNVYSSNGIAIGEGSKAWATNSMAIGQNSSAEQIGSVAIGYGSKTDRANSVSFGTVGNERVLTNIAAGEKLTDAVNKAQLDEVATQAGKSTSVIGSDNISVAKDVDGSITKYTVSLKNNVKLSDENGYTTISLNGDDGSASFADGKVNINADGSVTGLGFGLAETGASFKYGNSSVSFGADGAKFTNSVGSTTINGNAIATGSVTANSVTGLANKTWDANNITSGQAATEDQVKQAVDNVSTQVDNKVGDLNNLNEAIKGNNVVESLNKLDNKVGNLNDLHSDIKGSSVVDSINKVDDKITNVSGNVDKVTEKTTDITYDKATGTTTVGGSKFKDGNITTGNIEASGDIKVDGDVTTKDGASLNTVNKNVGDLTKLDKEITENDKYKNNQNVVGGINAEADIRKNEVSRLDNRVDVLDNRVGSLENRVADVEERIDKVGAMSAAIANLRTMGYDPEAPTELAIGIGQYKSETGLALGLFHYPNQDFMLSASISTSGDEVMGGIGATWKLGRKTPEQRAQIEARHKAEKAEALKLAAKQAEVKAQAERHAKLAQERHNQQVKEA